MKTWRPTIRMFEFSRVLNSVFLLFIYYHYYLLYIQTKASGTVVVEWLDSASGPGFESQVPQIASWFFLSGNLMRLQVQGLSYTLIIQPARWPDGQIQRPAMEEHQTPSQTPCMGSQKVKTDLHLQIAILRPKSLSLYFFLFVLINLFILFTNKIIIFFLSKKSQK